MLEVRQKLKEGDQRQINAGSKIEKFRDQRQIIAGSKTEN
jgi:hypothetical protein